MLPMTMIGKVRRMFHRQDKSVREIARLTSLSRITIRKYLKEGSAQEPKYERAERVTKLTPFHEKLIEALVVDALATRKALLCAALLLSVVSINSSCALLR